MNKILSIIISVCFIFAGVLHAQNFAVWNVSDDNVREKINRLSLMLDDKKSKKEIMGLTEKIGEVLLNANEYGAAETVYKHLLKANIPKKKKFYYQIKLGDLHALQENYKLSLDWYRKAQDIYKKNIEAKLKIGDILIKSNLYNLAEQSFFDALKINKNSDYAKKRLGDIYYYQELYAKAWQYYCQRDPEKYTEDTIINMAVCSRSLDKTEEGIRLVSSFLEKQESAELFFMSGLLYSDKQNYKMAERQFLNSLGIDENNFVVNVHLAGIYLNNGDLDKAKGFLDKAYAINSSYAAVDLMYAEIAFNSGKLYEARRYAHNAFLKAKTPFVQDHARKMIEFLTVNDTRF